MCGPKLIGEMDEGICRLCCKSDNVLLEVFVDVAEEISLAAKIFVCFGVKIQQDDAITKRVCKSCYFFTNSAYEYRISAQQNDVKLKRAHEETLVADEVTLRAISQDDFLNTLNLANRNNVTEKPKARQYHPSVQRLKRKYPEINIPAACHRINIEPIVLVDRTDIDQWNDELTNLGIWAVNRKKFQSQTGVTLTRVRRKSVDYIESSDTSERSTPAKKKKKKILWCEPKSKSLRFTLRKRSKQFPGTPSPEKEKKTARMSGEEESVDQRNDDCVVDVQPRVTRSATKVIGNAFGEIINLSRQVNLSDDDIEVSVESDGSEKLPNLEEIVSESLQNLGSNEPAAVDSDGSEKQLDRPIDMAVEDVQSDELGVPVNQMKITAVHTLAEQMESSSSDIPLDEHETDSINNDLLMAMGQEVTYICQTCNKIFDSLDLLNSHKKYSHRTSLRCYKCSKKFSVVEDQINHMLLAHSEVHESVPSPTETYASATPENIKFKISPPDNNNDFEVIQPANTTSVICKVENATSPVTDYPNPIFEMLPETGTVVGAIASPSQSSGSTDSLANSHSRLRELLGHPEELLDSAQNSALKKSNQKLHAKYVPPILKRVARKSTARNSWTTKDKGATETQMKRDSKMEECVISSDDDVEITSVVRKIAVIEDVPGSVNAPGVVSTLHTVLDTALQAQLKQVPQVNLSETSRVDTALTEKAQQTQILPETDNESATDNVKLREDQVLLIVESDPEDDAVLFVPNESSEAGVTSAEDGPANKVDKSRNEQVPVQDNSLNSDARQRIMMVSNPQDKRTASECSIANNKITNEDSYINYIFNKCRYSDKVAVGEQKWILKDLQPLLNRNYVPVEVEFSKLNDITASYTVPRVSSKNQTQGYWNYESAVKLPRRKTATGEEKFKVEGKGIIRNLLNNKVPSANGKPPASVSNKESTISNSSLSLPSTYTDPVPTCTAMVPVPSTMVSVPYTAQSVPYLNTQAVVTDNMLNTFLGNSNPGQNHSPKVSTGNGDQINLIYILESTPGKELASNTGAPQLTENSVNKPNDHLSNALVGSQQKHILLSGTPYPNYTKFRYDHMDPGQPFLFRPLMTPSTNVNIQNFVSVNQTNIASTSTDIREQYVNTAPVVMGGNQTNPSAYSTCPMPVTPGTSSQSDLTLKDPLTKPSIRIKDLSELTGKAPVNIVDRNLLHGFYSNTVNNYISQTPNNATISAPRNQSTDEFMQIS